MTTSDKIDRIVTNRWLGLPIFVVIMWFVYWVSIQTIGDIVTGFTNDVFVGEWIQAPVMAWLESIGTAGWLVGSSATASSAAWRGHRLCAADAHPLYHAGHSGRRGLHWRAWRSSWTASSASFGLSGKSSSPADRLGLRRAGRDGLAHIEQDRDRKMTIMTTTFIPCGARCPSSA